MSIVISRELREAAFSKLRTMKRRFAGRGWFPATSGNLSVRLGEGMPAFAVTASGKDKNIETDEDFLIVDMEGRPLEETACRPSAETAIHCEIYRLTSAGAIFHVHTVFNNLASELYSARGSVPIADVELIKAFNIWDEAAAIEVPILPNYAEIPRIAALIEGALGSQQVGREVPGFLLRKHGICAWGEDDFAACRHLEAFEFLLEYVCRLYELGRRS